MKTFKLLSVILAGFFVIGCAPSPTEGLISVIDLDTGNAVPNAQVSIFVDNPGSGFYLCGDSELTDIMKYTTNAGGVTEVICFKLPAVLKVEVSGSGGKTGTTTLSLVEGERTTAVCKVSN